MARIYRSFFPDYVIPQQSVFSKLFPAESPFDDALPAFIDAATGLTLSRAEVKDLSLRLGHSAQNTLKMKRGDTIMIFRWVAE